MDLNDLERALDYLEAHLTEELDDGELARSVHASRFHFRRMFGLLCGVPLGEYIRRRRLSCAAKDLRAGEKVLDVALRYGYGSSESFSRAFEAFHGVKPSVIRRGAPAKEFPRLSLGPGDAVRQTDVTIKEFPAETLVGFKKRFRGALWGDERLGQEDRFYRETLGKQWLLHGASGMREEEYAVIAEAGDDGYDYYIAYALDDWSRAALGDPSVMGLDLSGAGFLPVELPARLCAVFSTRQSRHPISDYAQLRRAIAEEWSRLSDYEFADAPEVVCYRWHVCPEERIVEIRLPVKRVGIE